MKYEYTAPECKIISIVEEERLMAPLVASGEDLEDPEEYRPW